MSSFLVQEVFKIGSGCGITNFDDLFRRACPDDLSTADPAFWPKVDDPVSRLYDIEVVFDDHKARAVVDQCTKRSE